MRDRTTMIVPRDILLFAVLRNERARLPYFFDYYRKLGIGHFLIVDNGSDDGSREWLVAQPDVSVWGTGGSYRRSRYGVDWLNWLKHVHAHNRWALTVDLDEFFVYPFCDTRPISALTDWLDTAGVKSFGAMMLDMYPEGDPDHAHCAEGQNPVEVACWFDPGNYTISRHPLFRHLWIQGGPRARAFFADRPEEAPALNKIPLVKWNRRYTYASSTHMLLPRGLNLVYDDSGGEKASGVLLHAKFLGGFAARAEEELRRKEHFAQSREYAAYARRAGEGAVTLWCDWSERYVNWRQLELLGLMSKGSWA